jgi:hypothetical protein
MAKTYMKQTTKNKRAAWGAALFHFLIKGIAKRSGFYKILGGSLMQNYQL